MREPVSESELRRPTPFTLLRLVGTTVVTLVRDPIGLLLLSAFLLVMLWGPNGELPLLGVVWPGWEGPGSDPATREDLVPGVPWDQEWISFWVGAVLLVAIPCVLIVAVFGRSLKEFGLGWPPPERRRLMWLSAACVLIVSAPFFVLAAGDDAMRATYPLYRGSLDAPLDFALYELGYLPFFLAIEFMFRGYLLLGLYRVRDAAALPGVGGAPGPLLFGSYAVLLSMLAYTAWHLGKPTPELWGTLVWGLLTGPIALATGTIWHLVIVHWLLNVLLDLTITTGLYGGGPG